MMIVNVLDGCPCQRFYIDGSAYLGSGAL